MPGKNPGKPSSHREDGAPGEGRGPASRLAELKSKVTEAAERITELREANYALKTQVAELRHELSALEAAPAPDTAPPEDASHHQERLELLLAERKAIRNKIEKLIERVERIES